MTITEVELFPDQIAEPAFVRSSEVAEVLDEVVHHYREFEQIAEALDEDRITLACFFETKPFDTQTEDYKPHTIAKVTKASPLWQAVSGRDVVVQYRRWFWQRFTSEQNRAVIYHELAHIEIDEHGKVKLRDHDIEEFSGVVRHFGPVIPGRAAFIRSYLAWEGDEDARRQAGAMGDQIVTALRAPVAAKGADILDQAMETVTDFPGVTGVERDSSGKVRGITVNADAFAGDADDDGDDDPDDDSPDLCPNGRCVLDAGHPGACSPVRAHDPQPTAEDMDAEADLGSEDEDADGDDPLLPV